MTTDEILMEIVRQRKTTEALKLLVDYVIMESEQLKKDNMEYLSRLIAIRKINKSDNGKGRAEAIENLCNLDER